MEKNSRLIKVDGRRLNPSPYEIHAFACIRNENIRLPYLLEYHRDLGVDRFFFIDNGSTDGSLEYLLEQPDCHVFHSSGRFFSENVNPPVWSNALRNTFCEGHWCLSLDADELFAFPHCEELSIRQFATYLDKVGSNAVQALVVDMYARDPISKTVYRRGQNFTEAFPYFDGDLGHELIVDGGFPSVLTFSRFRERTFWKGAFKRQRPPCITQVPFIKWHKGTAYKVAQHMVNKAEISEVHGAILHFKFFPGFLEGVQDSLIENKSVREKGLDERQSYVDVLNRTPNLSLHHDGSVKYANSAQLVELGWMRTSDHYERSAKSSVFAKHIAFAPLTASVVEA